MFPSIPIHHKLPVEKQVHLCDSAFFFILIYQYYSIIIALYLYVVNQYQDRFMPPSPNDYSSRPSRSQTITPNSHAGTAGNTISPYDVYHISLSFRADERDEYEEFTDQMTLLYGKLLKAYPALHTLTQKERFEELQSIAGNKKDAFSKTAATYMNLTFKRRRLICLASARVLQTQPRCRRQSAVCCPAASVQTGSCCRKSLTGISRPHSIPARRITGCA